MLLLSVAPAPLISVAYGFTSHPGAMISVTYPYCELSQTWPNQPPLALTINRQTSQPNQMNILESINTIDNGYEPDAAAMIDVIGTTADGRTMDLWIHNDGTGPLVHPGSSFLPYGGIYFNPLLVSVTEGILRR